MALAAVKPEHILMAAALRRRKAALPSLPWRQWVPRYVPAFDAPMAERHIRVWDWAEALTPGIRPRPLVEVWPRGSGKSSTIEAVAAYVGSEAKPRRRFVLYVSETQAQADSHVQAIGSILESVGVSRAMTKYKTSRGWTQQRLRAANGFNVQAFGLDAGMRGIKLDDVRPDIIVFDDIDGRHDTEATIAKKIKTITETIMPAGSTDAAIIVVQNLVHENSIVARLADGRADFLHDRLPVTVEQAVDGLQVERRETEDGTMRYVITGGTATWAGQSLETCEQQINDWGWTAFDREAQQNVAETEGGLWRRERDIDPFRVQHMPECTRIVVGVDPNSSGTNDEAGIIVAGVARRFDDSWHPDLHGFVLADRTVQGGPEVWAEAAVAAYRDFGADELIAEVNNGGEMVALTIGTIPGAPPVTQVHASRGKLTRAEPVQKLASVGRIHHVGVFPELERQMTRWNPHAGMPSPDRMDACFVAGTRVRTNRGDIPIEDVRVGDMALTRSGWHPVTNCGMTNANAEVMTVEFSDGRSLVGTPNHPVFTTNRGFVPLDALVWSDIIVTDDTQEEGGQWQHEKTSSSSTGQRLFGIRTASQNHHVGTISRTKAVAGSAVLGCSIRRFGSRYTGRFLPGMISTIVTATRSTITSTTSNASRRLNTRSDMLPSFESSGSRTSTVSGITPVSGTAVLKVERGTESTVSKHGKAESPSTKFNALTVARWLSRTFLVRGLPGIAVAGATVPLLTQWVDIPERQSARSAASHSGKTNTERSPKRARAFVVRSYASGSAPVYNLEVASHPEYFANGVLVHNCVWAMTSLLVDDGDYSELDAYMARQLGGRR